MTSLPVVEIDSDSISTPRYFRMTDGSILSTSAGVIGAQEVTEAEANAVRADRESQRQRFLTTAAASRAERQAAAAAEVEETRRLHAETQDMLNQIRELMAGMNK